MVHLLLVMHVNWLLAVVNKIGSIWEGSRSEVGSWPGLANLATRSCLVHIVTHVLGIQREECL